jgi:type II secretory pathway component GspD/PulD (secretin)
MNMKNIISCAAGALAVTAVSITATAQVNVNPTAPYDNTQVQPQIRLNLENDTDAVHFIRDNTDPFVVTKAYRLKHADPYELRPYLRDAVTANKISGAPSRVECLKYNNGMSFIVVSAEEDRFGPQPDGMGIDEFIEKLDQPKITSSSGSTYFLYFPMYRNARELETMIKNVGMDVSGTASSTQLEHGKDKVKLDDELNALFFYTPKYSKKNIEDMLSQYDKPVHQVAVKYTVYEVYGENDGKIGADFQSWKNNDGMDLLSMGGRYRSNWTATFAGGIDPGTGSNKTQFLSVNPKWNSKYLDFLVSKSSAKIMTTGEVVVKHGTTGTISKINKVFYSEKVDNSDTHKITETASRSLAAGTTTVVGTDGDGTNINYVNDTGAAVTVYSIAYSADTVKRYQVAANSGYFTKDGKNLGSQTDMNTRTGTWTAVSANDITVEKGPVINTKSSSNYGFEMTVTPLVGVNATTLTVDVTNTSLIGWNSNGSPRVSDANQIKTKVVISNKSNRFVLGGVEKSNVVRSVSGIPYLRQIPVLGWIFGSESESTKHSHLVIVAECELRPIDAPVSHDVSGEISTIQAKTANAGETNKWGFDQYLIDKK